MSNLGGGRSSFRMTPMREDGRTRKWEDIDSNIDILGCHAGDSAGMNIVNPQPGFEYQWVRSDATSQMLERQKGGTPIAADDPEAPAYTIGLTDTSDGPTPLDSGMAYKDVVLYRYPSDRMAERHKEDAARAERAVTGAADQYLHGASPAELSTSSGARTRFARRDHALQMQDETGAVKRQWTPERSILENE